jgi:hypothetical protein
MKERKPQPSPVGVVFRGHHERAGWSWADAMRAMERNADAEKAGPENLAAPLALAPPPGDGGGKGATGWAGDLGKQTRLVRGVSALGMNGCLRTGALAARTSAKVRISSQRDSEAAVLHTTAHCATLYSVQKGTRERGVSARKE